MGIIMYNNKIYSGGNEDILAPTPFIYSEDEQQVGIWTDGKPLYQKTFPVFQFNGNTTDWTLFDDSVSYEHIVDEKGIFGIYPFTSNDQLIQYDGRSVSPRFAVKSDHKLYYYVDNIDSRDFRCIVTIQYTKTTDTAWQGGFKAYGFSPIIYSETEREVGVWTDGKPLYQKTIEGTITIGAVNNIDLSSLNIDTFVSIEGVFDRDNTDFPINTFYSNSLYSFFGYNKNNHSLRAQIFADASTGNFKTTIQYTKTTDAAGSGKYTTLGVPAVHYDDTERVIGTWFGETLYQKTIFVQNITISANSNTNLTISDYFSNVGFIVAYECTNGDTVFPNIMASSGLSAYSIGVTVDRANNHLSFTRGGGGNTTISTYITLKYTKTS